MKKLFYLNPVVSKQARWINFLASITKLSLLVLCIFSLSNSFAQNLPPASSCTSGDLLLVGATLPPNSSDPICGDCISGTPTSRTLYLSINNKTGSQRTSFAFWGTLNIYYANGSLKSSTPISRCGGPIEPSMINKISVGSISYVCGESIQLTNLFLAWTTSNKKETCDWLLANPSTINPKCGVLPSISVFTGLDADIEATAATCISGGSIKVSPGGGKANYTVSLGNDTRTVEAFTSTTFANLPQGTYSVKITDANGCIKTKGNIVVGSATGVSVSAGSPFTKTCLANTAGKQIGEATETGYTYSWSPTAGLSDAAAGNPTANPSSTTTYTVTKTKTSTGCSNTASVTVTVDNETVSVSAGAAFTKTCLDNIAGSTIGEVAESGFTYSWSPASGLSSASASSPTANPSSTTTYTVTKTKTSSGCSNTASVTVTVDNDAVAVSAGAAFTKTCLTNANGKQIGESTVAGYTYSWNPATGLSNASASNPTANPSSTTTYTVTKTKTSSGCSNTASVTVTVDNDAVTVSAGAAFTKTCLANASGKQIGETAESGYTYSWSPATGLSSASASNPTANPSVTTTYTVTKTKTSSGCLNTASVTVTVDNDAVTVSAGAAFTKTCLANTTGKQIGETNVAGYTYSWSPATGLSDASASNPTANPSASTTYTVTKTKTSSGCSNTASVTVTVDNDVVVANAGAAFTKTCITNANGKQIGESAVAGYTYSWSPTAGLSNASASNPTANPSSTTTYTVTKTKTSSGCSNTASVTVTVDNDVVAVSAGAAFTKTCLANPSGKQIGEIAESGYTYSWSPATGLSSASASNPTANPSGTTTYTVTKTKTSSGCANTASVTVTVNTAPPTFTVCLVQPTLCANSGSVTINATGGSGFTYSINGTDFSNTTGVFTGLGSGSVTSIKVRNSDGCESAAADCSATSVCDGGGNITNNSTPGSVNAVSAIQPGVSVANRPETSIDNVRSTETIVARIDAQSNVMATPNPYSDKIRFVLQSAVSGQGSLELFNMAGQKIKTLFQGYVFAGKGQVIEYVVPQTQSKNIVYVFTVAGQKTTGTLIGIK